MRWPMLLIALGFVTFLAAILGGWSRMDRAELLIDATGMVACGGILVVFDEIKRIKREIRR